MEQAIILLAGILLLAMIIERLLEILKTIFNVYETKKIYQVAANNSVQRWDRVTEKLAQFLFVRDQNQVGDMKTGSGRGNHFHLDLLAQYIFTEDLNYQGTRILSADKVRTIFITYAAKVIGVLLGVLVAFVADLNIFELIKNTTPKTDEKVPDLFNSLILNGFLGTLVTGIAMGLGSGPLHKFIQALERARKKRKPSGAV